MFLKENPSFSLLNFCTKSDDDFRVSFTLCIKTLNYEWTK